MGACEADAAPSLSQESDFGPDKVGRMTAQSAVVEAKLRSVARFGRAVAADILPK